MSDELRYEVSIEGQKIPLPAELASDDKKILDALVPFFPGITNGKIMRGEPIDGLVTITIIKQAGTKGASRSSDGTVGGALQKLRKAKSEKNPVVALMEQMEDRSVKLHDLAPTELIKMDRAIEKALEEGEKEANWIKDIERALRSATPMSSPVVPEGF